MPSLLSVRSFESTERLEIEGSAFQPLTVTFRGVPMEIPVPRRGTHLKIAMCCDESEERGSSGRVERH